MILHSLFPTLLYSASLQSGDVAGLNKKLLRECIQLRSDDVAGRRWSAKHYLGGYTSYGSQCQLQRISPTFALLEKRLQRHVRAFARTLEFDLVGRELVMTDCWVNIMPRGVVHSMHLHPLSTFSGTYYVRTPSGVPGLKLEDPRLDRFMAAPPKRVQAPASARPWFILPVRAGQVALFESWLRHEVPPNPVVAERVSISFNFSWF